MAHNLKDTKASNLKVPKARNLKVTDFECAQHRRFRKKDLHSFMDLYREVSPLLPHPCLHFGALLLRIKPTSWRPVLQIPILYYDISYG